MKSINERGVSRIKNINIIYICLGKTERLYERDKEEVTVLCPRWIQSKIWCPNFLVVFRHQLLLLPPRQLLLRHRLPPPHRHPQPRQQTLQPREDPEKEEERVAREENHARREKQNEESKFLFA